ncbi:hypothetical protein DERP_000930 [Dermatophagoides pteronyssinus]|uniref:Uncharacterized protein n=1 Tax=Dermatophagoides pteronyssinus TaxID=6956 RepID=A0ABQ8JD23_DERPT|nr:hypothetical protein DERP_000930 [Dermatophagoides pteronyssinus]
MSNNNLIISSCEKQQQQQSHINDNSNVITTDNDDDDDAFFSSFDNYVVDDDNNGSCNNKQNDIFSISTTTTTTTNNNNQKSPKSSETFIMIEQKTNDDNENQQIRRPDDDDDESFQPKTKIIKSSSTIEEESSLMIIDSIDMNKLQYNKNQNVSKQNETDIKQESSISATTNKVNVEQSNKDSTPISEIQPNISSSPMTINKTSDNQKQQINSSTLSSTTTTTTTTTTSIISSSSSSSVSATQTSIYLSQDQDEMPRHTICPLCENTRSFCSSSSVTRHIRSVHKLTDLTEAKYCYCLFCQQFQEDIHSYYRHLEHGHQFDLDRNFSLLFTKKIFASIEEFQQWKDQELEPQTGCRYERCFSYDFPRSIYYKCSGIQLQTPIQTETDDHTKQQQQSIILKYNQNPQSSINQQQQQGTISTSGSQTMTKIEMADLSKIFSSQQQQQQTSLSTSSSSSSSNLDNSDNSQSSSTGTLANVQGINVRIENQYDSRMYPCPSSVRLIFKKNHIQVNYIPFHLGHVLTSNNTPPSSSSSSQPSNVQQQVSNNQQQRASTASTNQSIQTPVQVQIQQQQPQPQTTTTKCHQPLQTNFISMSKNKNSNNNSHQHHQVVAIATGPNNGQQQQQTAIQISPQQLAGLASSGNIQLATTTGIGGSKLIHLPFLNLATVGGGNIVLTTANSNQQHSANPIQLKTTATTITISKIDCSFISGGSLGSAKILTSPKNRLMQAIPIEKTSTTFKTNVDVSTQSDTLPSSAMLNQLNFQQLINNQSNHQQKIKSQQIQLISTIPTTKPLQIQQQQLNGSAKTTYQPVQQSYQLADSSSISTPTSASTSINSSPMMMKLTNDTQAPTSSTLNSTVQQQQQQQSNGLVIVSLEKGLETVQEQSRPRKKQLRQIFEQILESCFTESDFDLLESSLTSIATHFQLTNNTMNNNIP